jgi:hypothetical protein
MTALQKILSTVALIALGAALIYEARKASDRTDQVQVLQREHFLLAEQNENLTRQRGEALSNLDALRDHPQAKAYR